MVLVVGCGGAEKDPNTPACPPGQTFDGRYCQMTSPAPAPVPSATTPAPSPLPPAPPAPSPLLATATCSNPTAPLDAAAAQVATALIGPLAAQKAMPGAKPLGPALAGNFQTGQCLETTITVSPGKCYSVVGVGLPTLQNLDLALVPAIAIPGVPPAVAAADKSVGSTAVLGEAPSCFKWALPVSGTMKLVMTASAGQGVAAAQVYEK